MVGRRPKNRIPPRRITEGIRYQKPATVKVMLMLAFAPGTV